MEPKVESLKMICNGFALGVVNDLQPKGKFHYLQNIRIVTEGVLESRPLVEQFLTLNPAPNVVPHTIKTIINRANDSFLRIAGAGNKLFTGTAPILNELAAGFSGKPFFFVDFRPEQSIEAYLYIADENKFVKVSVSNVLSDVGITAPAKSAIWSLSKPERKIIDKITVGSDIDWNNLTGSAAAPTLQVRVNTIVETYLPDDILPSFASIVPDDGSNIQKDSIVTINGIDKIVEEFLPISINAGIATIAKISYDFGVSGPCTIVLSVSSADIRRNSVLKLNNAEYVRVEDVTRDSNNIPSIRTTTAGTFINGQPIEGVPSFRIFTDVAFANGQPIVNDAIKTTINAAGVSSITRVFNVDLLNTGVNGKPLTLDDLFHGSFIVDSSKISEIQIQLDVDDGSFTKNYFFYPISPNFFTDSVSQTSPILSVIQQTINRQEILDRFRRYNDYGSGIIMERDSDVYDFSDVVPTTVETTTGDLQWTELDIRLSDFRKVGSDPTKTLKDVKAIRISVNATAALDVYLDSIWVGGSGALDTTQNNFLPYNYVWRVRDPNTRASSNWSPPLRSGIKVTRGNVSLSFPDANAIYPPTYRIDVARFGGTISEFRIVGSILNDGTEFLDTSSDRLVQDNPLAGRFSEHGATDAVFDFYKPFAILDKPKVGGCRIIGTKFTRIDGDMLNVTYPRGTQVVIHGIANKFFSSPTDTDHVELENDMGDLAQVKFEIQEPLLTGQPLPVIFGPTGEGFLGLFIFGLGDKNAAGTVYWLDGNSPDTMSDQNRLEITSPSEPLVAGVIYDGFPHIYSISRSFVLQPTISPEGNFSFIARENANSRGVFCRNSICVGPSHIFFLSENADGIYRVQGNGNPECITNGTFSNLFFTEDDPKPVELVDGTVINPPDFTALDDIRFFSTNNYTIFRFKDTNGKPLILVYSNKINDFISRDKYKNDEINAFYREETEAGTNFLVGIKSGVGKFGTSSVYEDSPTSKVIPFSFDAGDSRLIKEFKEIIVDANTGLEGLSARNYYNNGDTNDPNANLFGGDIRKQFIINLQDAEGVGKLVKNITTVFEWLISSGVKLYEEKFYIIPKNDIIENRSSDIEDNGDAGAKLWQGVIIKADTFGQNKQLHYHNDLGVRQETIIINHDGERTIAYSFDPPFISHTIRRVADDGIPWIPMTEVYITDREPESAKTWEGEFNTHDLTGLIMIQRFAIAYRSDANATLKLTFEDGEVQDYINILPNSNGNYNKEFFFTRPKKWKACKYRIETNGKIRIYRRDCEIWMKSFGSDKPFQRFSAFGGSSRETEILI